MPEAKTRKFFFVIGQEPSNSIVLALTRGGKDVYFINPFIDILSRAERIGDRPSFVMTATKGDEPRMWYDTLRKRGYLIRICKQTPFDNSILILTILFLWSLTITKNICF